MRKLAPVLAVTALVLAGCGGGDKPQQAAVTATATTPAPAPEPTTTRTTTRTTPSPPPVEREPKAKRERLHPTVTYRCNGERLRGLSASGPVKVEPRFVKPGQSFQVIVTDPSARTAEASLTGVSTQPIMASARQSTRGLAATLRVPAGASCGNKLVTVEGDVSAQAYVGVGR